jgi:glycosyltransferase involved in cell wall biosynthesis
MQCRFQKWFYVNFFERINYHTVNNADLVVTHSSFYEHELATRYSLQRVNRIIVIAPGIDLKKIQEVRQKCRNNRFDDSAITPAFNIGVVGSANWWDGSDILLESMPIIAKSQPNVVLNFVFGTGDMRIVNDLKLRAKELNIENIVFKGPLTHEEALAEMCQLSALVLPRRRTLSTEFTIPIKVMEALALGVPVIITHHKVFDKAFKNYEDFIYVEPEAKDVAKKVLLLLSNPTLIHCLSERGLKRAMALSYDQVSEDFANALLIMSNES